MSDAFGDCARRAGLVSYLRHGAGAADCDAGGQKDPGTNRYVATVLGEPRPVASVAADRDERNPSGKSVCARRPDAHHHLDPIGAGNAGGVVGWLAVFCAGMAVNGESQPEYVHADWTWGDGRLRVQPDRDAGAANLSRVLSRSHGECAGLL